MDLDALGREWEKFRQGLHATVLVVDDEPVVRELLDVVLSEAGLTVETTETAEEAWSCIEDKPYDLVVADKNLPGMSGVELIAKIKDTGLDIPSVMVTGYASIESVSAALSAGALDYVAKPFDDIGHIRKRITSILERRMQSRLYDRMVHDLSSLVTSGGSDKEMVTSIGKELFTFKRSLNARPRVLLVDSNPADAGVLADSLLTAGQTVEIARSPGLALNILERADSPLMAIVSLELPDPPAFLREARSRDALLPILVATSAPRLRTALEAVTAGASDLFIRAVESMEALESRVRRAVQASYRHRLYLHLIATLHTTAKAQGHPVAAKLYKLLPDAHRTYLEQMVGTAQEDLPGEEVDLSGLFNDIVVSVMPADRRRHPRVEVSQVEAKYRIKGSQAQFNSGRLRDISFGGMFLRINPPLPRGTRLEILLTVDGDNTSTTARVEGKAVRTVLHDPDPDRLSGNGVVVTEQTQIYIRELVERLTAEADPEPEPESESESESESEPESKSE